MWVFIATATVFFVFVDSARVFHKVSLPSIGDNRQRTKKFLVVVARLLAERQKASSIFFPSIKTAEIIARCQHIMLHAGGDARERIKIAFNIKTLKVLQNSTVFHFPQPRFQLFMFCYHRIFYGRPSAPEGKSTRSPFDSHFVYFDNSPPKLCSDIF